MIAVLSDSLTKEGISIDRVTVGSTEPLSAGSRNDVAKGAKKMRANSKHALFVLVAILVASRPFAGLAKEYVIAYSQAELVNAWRVTNQKDMEASAQKLGVKLISLDANQDPAKQLGDIQNMLAQKPNALVLSPLESKALVPALKMCEQAKVPLIVIDRTIEAQPGAGVYKTEITSSRASSWRRRRSIC